MDKTKSIGYIFNTGTSGGDELPFQHLVTIDSPTSGQVVGSCVSRQGLELLSTEIVDDFYVGYMHYIHVLPTPGGTTDQKYEFAHKQTYRWKSKKYVMAGRTNMTAAKITMDKGCVRLRIHVDGCCRYDAIVQNCAPFRLPDQMVGIEWEIELIGQARIYQVHIASTIEELTRVRQSG